MSKNLKSLADRLILLVARLGERATVQNITGRHLVGLEFEQAKQDAKGLVVWEPVYQMRRRRPGSAPQRSRKASTTARLTKAGIWRAAQLGVPYSPGLVDTLVGESEKPLPHSRVEKQREVEIAALVSDGKEYRRQIAARKTAKDEAAKAALVGPRRKRSPRHYEKLNKFLVSRGMQPTKVSAFGNGLTLRQPEQFKTTTTNGGAAVAAYAAQSPKASGYRPSPVAIAPTDPTEPATPARPLPEYDFARELADIQGRKLVGIGEPSRGFDNNPKALDRAPTGETRVEVMARAHADGCVTQHAGLMFEGEEFGRDWKRFAVASKKKRG